MRFIDLLARALMAQIFIIAGWGKLGAGYDEDLCHQSTSK